jgi:alkyl sulfatase BDS1-like metallo-beta-lactamase superfamily hydrolase
MFIPQVTPIQPINVVVQQAPGMPEWVRTLLAAVTGAFFGIAATFVTEYLKRLNLKKEVEKQLGMELMENLTIAENGYRILQEARDSSGEERKQAAARATQMARTINADRFSYYFAGQKSLVYEVDQKKQAGGFYAALKNALPLLDKERDFNHIKVAYGVAVAIGRGYVRDHNLEYVPHKETLGELYKITIDD